MRNLLRRIGLGSWMADIPAPVSDQIRFILKLGDLDVATLTRENGEWVFQYSQAFQLQHKIQPIIGFPDKFTIYRSADLWPFFQIRIPSMLQTDVRRYLVQHKLQNKDIDQSTLLEHFGRRSISNPFELVSASR